MSDIFVFGSNLAGRHGAGAALYARNNRGAIYGKGFGLQGESFAIPTKDSNLRTLSLQQIAGYVASFLAFARTRPDLRFQVTAVGTGLAGYAHRDIAPMFKNAPANCRLPEEWAAFINGERK